MFRAEGIACNGLWLRATVATTAVEFALGGEEMMRTSRSPQNPAATASFCMFPA
jgi:citronellol/citronellal dehydrogenase